MECVSIFVTKRCNMDCEYCYVKKASSLEGEEFTLEDILNNIDNRLANIKEHNVKIEFMGGEPLMRMDILEYVCDYIKTKFNHINTFLTLTTNCTFYSKGIIDLIKKYNIQVTLSIDGSKFFHNLYRKFKNGGDTWDVVYKNALDFLAEVPDNINVSMTLNRVNIDYLLHNILELYNMGFKRINFTYNRMDLDKYFVDAYAKQIKNYYNKYDFKDLDLLPICNTSLSSETVYDEDGNIIAELKTESNNKDIIGMVNDALVFVKNKWDKFIDKKPSHIYDVLYHPERINVLDFNPEIVKMYYEAYLRTIRTYAIHYQCLWVNPLDLVPARSLEKTGWFVANDPYLKETENDNMAFVKDIRDNGTFWHIPAMKAISDDGKIIAGDGMHRLWAMQQLVKIGEWPKDKKVLVATKRRITKTRTCEIELPTLVTAKFVNRFSEHYFILKDKCADKIEYPITKIKVPCDILIRSIYLYVALLRNAIFATKAVKPSKIINNEGDWNEFINNHTISGN